LPTYHLMAADELFGRGATSMLLIAMGNRNVCLSNAWRAFELIPAHIIAVKAAYSSVLGRQPANWADVLPALFANSNVAKKIAFDLGPQPFLINPVTDKLPKAIQDDPEKFVRMGGVVIGRDKSSSEDTFHVQRLVGGEGHGVVGWQQKFLIGTALQMSMVRDEVAKSVKGLPEVLVIFAATVGPELLAAIDAAEGRVLVLPSWDENTSAEFAFRSSGKNYTLLWRAQTRGDESLWCVFPEQAAPKQERTPSQNNSKVIVRPGLEVIIPHHDVVREQVGADMFNGIVAAREGEWTPTSAALTNLDEVLKSCLSNRRFVVREAAVTAAQQHAPAAASSVVNEELMAFLDTHDLGEIGPELARQGAKRPSDLRGLTESDLKSMMGLIYAKKLMRALNGV
jgi:hypothetical protein